jgi:hypothetical protein
MKIEIKSDGTVPGTQVKLDGVDITATSQVLRTSFYASCMYTDGSVDFSYSVKEGSGDNAKIITKQISQSKESTGNDRTNGLGISEADDAASNAEMLKSNNRVGANFVQYVVDSNVAIQNMPLLADMIKAGIVKAIRVGDSNTGSSNNNE